MAQFDDHVKMRLTSQLPSGISRVLQKLLKYFNSAVTSTFFVLPSSEIFPIISTSDLNNSESAKVAFGSSL